MAVVINRLRRAIFASQGPLKGFLAANCVVVCGRVCEEGKKGTANQWSETLFAANSENHFSPFWPRVNKFSLVGDGLAERRKPRALAVARSGAITNIISELWLWHSTYVAPFRRQSDKSRSDRISVLIVEGRHLSDSTIARNDSECTRALGTSILAFQIIPNPLGSNSWRILFHRCETHMAPCHHSFSCTFHRKTENRIRARNR